MIINGLEVKKDKKDFIISDDSRSFKIYSNGDVESTWFCSYPVLLEILDYIESLNIVEEVQLFKEE
jgi:hypothetical protein